ncbi:hypothetical protein PF001_g12390 [Phytophthora fragariae]|uniref:Transmembrane protein n=1 Tax=Phytophthora fragariae TaxID=53985 RepID=A0A6A4DEL2_9STRA|nr:hypothetical protein PF004_g12213 [Phytophthora fragariae]KAE9305896.1 hypothetical protein PF001_g12390 [Phytophthora fragariae]
MAATDTCLPRLRMFLDASLLAALVLTALALRRRVVSSEPPPKPDDLFYDHLNRTFRRSVALTVLGLQVWGILGLVLALEGDCPASHWLVVLCLALSIGCMFVGAGLSAREALLTIDCDLLTLLWCLRCSCCSRLTKRALLLPPLALVATLNVASWLECRNGEACNAPELLSPSVFFAGTASVFLAMLVAILAAVGCSLALSRHRVTSTRVGKVLVALGLAVFALTSIGWAVVGLLSIPKLHNNADLDALYVTGCWRDRSTVSAAQWSIAQLLVVGGLLLVTTFCCRLEHFFLAPNSPEIDLMELSPRLAAINKTAEQGAIIIPYLLVFDFKNLDFPDSLLYGDTSFANLILENRAFFAISWGNAVFKGVPHFAPVTSGIDIINSFCLQRMHPWLAPNVSCAVVKYNCYREGVSSPPFEALDLLERESVRSLMFLHCSEFVMPPILHEFSYVMGIELWNTTLVRWGEEAALSAEFHPRMIYMMFAFVNLTSLRVGILSPPLPEQLIDLEFIHTNLTTLPDEVEEAWINVQLVYMEHSQLKQFQSV